MIELLYCWEKNSQSGINFINIAKAKINATTIMPKITPHNPPKKLSMAPIIGKEETPKKIFFRVLNINLNPIVVKIIIVDLLILLTKHALMCFCKYP